jgi:hypothetical protein
MQLLLVFGLGHDSPLCHELNPSGITVFPRGGPRELYKVVRTRLDRTDPSCVPVPGAGAAAEATYRRRCRCTSGTRSLSATRPHKAGVLLRSARASPSCRFAEEFLGWAFLSDGPLVFLWLRAFLSLYAF